MSKRTLYALLVGINQYESPDITPLNGCVNDVEAMQAFLSSQADLTVHAMVLEDAAATKTNIIKAFHDHLSSAQAEDSILFYFAGHGIQEETTVPLFAQAGAGGLLESLVCYDSLPHIQSPDHCGLADKELRFLLHELSLTGAEIAVVLDCCHSGTANRDLGKARQVREKPFPARDWTGFFFHEKLEEAQFQTGALKAVLPQGRQVFLSACSDTEYAWEHTLANGDKRGFFTYHLLNQLEKDPLLSFQQIIRRLISILGDRKTKIQHPQVDAFPPQSDQLNYAFLRKEKRQDSGTALLSYTQAHQWRIDKGAIHGLTDLSAQEGAKVLTGPGGSLTIKQIGPGFSLIDMPRGSAFNPAEQYPVEVRLEQLAKIPFYLDAPSSEEEELINAIEAEQKKYAGEPIWWVEEEGQAKYCVRLRNHAYQLTYSDDQRPLTAEIPINEVASRLSDTLNHVSRWEHIVQLGSPDDHAGRIFPVKAELLSTPTSSPPLVVFEGKPIALHLTEDLSRSPYRKVFLKLTNQSSRTLYVSVLYLPRTFGCDPATFLPPSMPLDPQASIYALEGEGIILELDDYIYDFQWEKSIERIKIIASTAPFDTELFNLPELPMPDLHRQAEPHRALRRSRSRDRAIHDQWWELTQEIHLLNPRIKHENGSGFMILPV
ncbi:MAG: caspase family protein [Bacteroidota bacterium]